MNYLAISVVLFSILACSGKQKEVATKRVNELVVNEKNPHLSIGSIEIGETIQPDEKQNLNLQLMGLKDFQETKVVVNVKTNQDCLLMAVENVNPMADSEISCQTFKEGTKTDQQYTKRTLIAFPPKRIMASTVLVKAGQQFQILGSVIKAKAKDKDIEVGHLRDAIEVK